MSKENRAYIKRHSDADEELAAKLIVELAVYSRLVQHLAWEMQYAFNGLEGLCIDCDGMMEKKIKYSISLLR